MQGGDPITQDSSVNAGKKLASPRHLLVSGTLLTWGRRCDGEAFECHSQWPLTGLQEPWNYLDLVLFWGETSFLSQVWGWVGQLCVGVAFSLCVVLNNVYNLPQSLL